MSKLGYWAILGLALGCSVSEKERCSEGRIWSDAYHGCLDAVGGASGTGGSSSTAPDADQDAKTETAAADNLGAACTEDTDCEGGGATFCLLNPQTPSAPGYCTILNCDSAACGASFDCCNCTASPVVASILPKPVCIPTSGVAQLTSLSCTCT